MFEINVTIHCPDLVAAAQLLAKCTGAVAPAPVVASPIPAAEQVQAPAQLQHPGSNHTTNGNPLNPTTPYSHSEARASVSAVTNSVPLAQAPTFTLAEISKAGADLIGTNPALLPKVNELLAQYGIQTLDKLKPDQFGAFATALRGLGAKI